MCVTQQQALALGYYTHTHTLTHPAQLTSQVQQVAAGSGEGDPPPPPPSSSSSSSYSFIISSSSSSSYHSLLVENARKLSFGRWRRRRRNGAPSVSPGQCCQSLGSSTLSVLVSLFSVGNSHSIITIIN